MKVYHDMVRYGGRKYNVDFWCDGFFADASPIYSLWASSIGQRAGFAQIPPSSAASVVPKSYSDAMYGLVSEHLAIPYDIDADETAAGFYKNRDTDEMVNLLFYNDVSQSGFEVEDAHMAAPAPPPIPKPFPLPEINKMTTPVMRDTIGEGSDEEAPYDASSPRDAHVPRSNRLIRTPSPPGQREMEIREVQNEEGMESQSRCATISEEPMTTNVEASIVKPLKNVTAPDEEDTTALAPHTTPSTTPPPCSGCSRHALPRSILK